MKKIVAALICGLICVAAIISAAVCSTRADYAKEHYENNYAENKDGVYYFSQQKYEMGYGCGENDCGYCNGGQYKKSLDEFVYLTSMNNGKTASTVVAVVFGIATLALSIWAFQPKKTDAEKTEE